MNFFTNNENLHLQIFTLSPRREEKIQVTKNLEMEDHDDKGCLYKTYSCSTFIMIVMFFCFFLLDHH